MKWNLLLLIWMSQCYAMICQLYQYHYINENKTWTEAQQYCRENHADLATVTNMKDMKRLINISAGDQSEAWIGLNDQTNGIRTWFWSLPGVEFNESETNWSPGEPNDYRGMQNCGILWNYLKWDDISCNENLYFLCYNDSNSSKKFHLIRENKNWTEAQSYCRENHTDLISGTKQLQDEEVKKETSSVGRYTYIFTGLFRDTWRWSDGSSFSFRHWNLKFDNQRINSGQCAMTVFDDGGRWKNENCTERKPFICYDDKVILIKENKTWKDALTYCRDPHHYDDLVTITNMDDQRWIQEKTKNASTPFVWLGLRFNCTLNFWFWVCKEMISYQNSTSAGWMNNCNTSGAMQAGGEHRWFQRNDTEELNFICSKV
ncbi:C-type mannose receptor 2-like [Xiphophorus hellerii]|uniref:C-type mannose receptor 2-like n=1 Tax=Xiphophorus hellerii TaxID=8084 RepID=UPI0013B3CFD5|nr:C-type mannose receptor 2-like [Xiphophorus hellerii]